MYKVLDDAETMLVRPSCTGHVALQLTDARLDTDTVIRLGKWLKRCGPRFYRLAVVGSDLKLKQYSEMTFCCDKHPNDRNDEIDDECQ